LGQQKLPEARRLAQELAAGSKLEPLRCEGLLLSARTERHQGNFDEAYRLLQRASAVFPADIELARERCELAFKYRPSGEAIFVLEQLSQLDLTDGSVAHNLGTLYLQAGRLDEAVDAYRESLRRRPISAATAFQLGCVLRHAGRLDEAEAALCEAIAIEPTHAGALEGLAAVEELATVPL
ncbi:MAG: tetratricopeptide repeat protein, partial [Pirellulaceae bacterium]